MIDLRIPILCGLIRLVISFVFPSLKYQLDNTAEFSTPFTSYKSLKEGVYLLRHGFSLYNGGIVHQPPILLAFLQPFMRLGIDYILYSVVDSIICYQIMELANSRSPQFSIFLKKHNGTSIVTIIGLLYALNPLTVLSTISGSSTIFTNLAISSTLFFISKEYILASSIAVAIAGYLSAYPILLVIPLLSLVHGTKPKSFQSILSNKDVKLSILIVLTSVLVFLLLSYQLSGHSYDYISFCYIQHLSFGKSFPNIGLWWYFFIEMFNSFVPFYKAVFNVFLFSFIVPFTMRFHSTPLSAFILSLGWITLTKPYPTLGDYGFFLSFLPLFQKLFGYMKFPVVSALLILHAIILSPLFYHLWIDLGSGNSNFFYALTLIYALGMGSILADITWASLRFEYDKGKPDYSKKITQI
ncbi:GPI transamidase component GAB1 [Nakaseomyces bracarensis]|uniref:GPI transamidase component GAB1 n=1 Tax=Nakaseomyces bracarensis TaxID=273131 RepID=A0ABR4NRJ4_9SACH